MIASRAGHETPGKVEVGETGPRHCRPVDSVRKPDHESFTLVLGGGGARGFAHIGVLRGLEAVGLLPSAVVGVSMGAIVAAVYGLREDWYEVLRNAPLDGLHVPVGRGITGPREGRIRTALTAGRVIWDLWRHWGVAETAGIGSRALLREWTRGANLEDARIDIAISATDLATGERVVIRTGSAADAAYASAALAGVVPPLRLGDRLIVDGAYSDIAPIDVARAFGHPVVLAVDPGQLGESVNLGNGLEVLVRAMEICHSQHAHLRFAEADLVLRPQFPRVIDTLDFSARRDCIAAGLRLVRTMLPTLQLRLAESGRAHAAGRAGSTR